MLTLGIDLGTSSVKVSVVDMDTQVILASASYPAEEAPIYSPKPGWAEQNPDDWWSFTQAAIQACHAKGSYQPNKIVAIGIAYQMHGLVTVDKNQKVLRPAIIWCDSRAVPYGDAALQALGAEYCHKHLLNSPANFTAAKLAWLKENEPSVYEKIDKVMLPGDFIAMKLTGEIDTTVSALSEGIFWDFRTHELSGSLMEYFGFDKNLIPAIRPLLGEHGRLKPQLAAELHLPAGIPVTYKAGDQLNNALSLSVFSPGQLAATGGTSGVLYSVSDQFSFDTESRINSFAHVTHNAENPAIGTLLCINGAGIFYKWFKRQWAPQRSYQEINAAAARIAAGSNGMLAIPFGNGAERMLGNRSTGAAWTNIDLNMQDWQQAARATLEGIAFAFRYGFEIMLENGHQPQLMRAPLANLFFSDVFAQSLSDLTGLEIEYYEGDGSSGAAMGAWLGWQAAQGQNWQEPNRKCIGRVQPAANPALENQWLRWKNKVGQLLAESK